MNESKWSACDDPQKLLKWLPRSGRASDRKWRLVAAACCQRIWPLLGDRRSRAAVETAERFADGLADTRARSRSRQAASYVTALAWRAVTDARMSLDVSERDKLPPFQAAQAATFALDAKLDADAVALWAAKAVGSAAAVQSRARTSEAIRQEGQGQADVIRDAFGPLPFRPVHIDPSLLRKQDGLVRKLAQAAYNHRDLPAGTLDTARLAVLADALEEAGYADAQVLGHLRRPGPHIRGCFALDAILGKS